MIRMNLIIAINLLKEYISVDISLRRDPAVSGILGIDYWSLGIDKISPQ